jgi:four helix bundle protein
VQDFKDIFAWKKAMELSARIYLITSKFPKEEVFGLTSQLRRASVSVPSNIAEGSGRKTKKDFCKFLYNAFGSIKEVECQIIISKQLNFMTEKQSEDILRDIKLSA